MLLTFRNGNRMGHRVAGILPAIRGRDDLDTLATHFPSTLSYGSLIPIVVCVAGVSPARPAGILPAAEYNPLVVATWGWLFPAL
jgi:hypothetical protein